MMKKIWFGVLCISIFASCSDTEYNECVFQPDLKENVSVEVEELHHTLLNIESADSLIAFMKANPIITEYFLKRGSYPNEQVMIETLLNKYQNPHIDTLLMEVDKVFGDLSGLKMELNKAFSHLKYYYPDATIPKIKTIATGLDFDLYVSDSLIVIGLDYYLGKDAKYRPINMYQYILKRYAPEYIVPSIMLLYGITPEYNRTSLKDKSILADMISYGKSFYFTKRMMPCVPDSVIIWYTQEEIDGARKNVDIIWTHFVENELLFETNHMVKKKYIDDRPKTYEIGDKAPGRIGTWLGWQIVNKYAVEHPQVSLPELMRIENPQRLFKESKFKPDKGGLF